jgi:hypothetical protein
VQYILEGAETISSFTAPPFEGFRIVSGPNSYSSKNQISRNFVFTLQAIKKGRFIIPAAVCKANGVYITSNDLLVEVKEVEDPADYSDYFLAKGEDPYKKIKANLFLKVMVDRTSCFVGEPVVATFKLYSRLQSRSNVIKNPGFYGFSVYDMFNVSDNYQETAEIGGKKFDVHTVRKVQLYPLQPGNFIIDAMEITNQVEFSHSTVGRKQEQEVMEDMFSSPADPGNAEIYELNLATDPITIHIKPLPGKATLDSFTGAVGNFSLETSIEPERIAMNEQALLKIVVSGSGNFQRVTPPAVQWPPGIEAFESTIKDSLEKQQSPLAGSRTFNYIFSGSKPGFYTIPALSFSYFDSKLKKIRTISTEPVSFTVNNEVSLEKPSPISKKENINWKLIFIPVFSLAILVAIVFLLLKRKKRKEVILEKNKQEDQAAKLLSTENILAPARETLHSSDKNFLQQLNHAIWDWFKLNLGIEGNKVNKHQLSSILQSRSVPKTKADELVEMLHKTELGIYTDANILVNKQELYNEALGLLKEIKNAKL